MEQIPKAVRQLQLGRAFKGFATSLLECIETTQKEFFYVEDDEKEKYTHIVTTPTDGKYGLIENPRKEEAVVLAIDNKLISNHAGGGADGAVFNLNYFHFIEFKTNAEGHSPQQVNDTYDKAIQQLQSSLNLFSEKVKTPQGSFRKSIHIAAHIIVSKTFPRVPAMEMTKSLQFSIETKGIPLYFDPVINIDEG